MIEGLPPLQRARGYRLYDQRGKRYLDFYQNGGRAFLGHRPEGVTAEIKRILDRGLYSPYPSIYTRRLKQALCRWLPGFPKITIYKSRESLLQSLKNNFDFWASREDLPEVWNENPEPPGRENIQFPVYRPGRIIPQDSCGIIPVIPLPFSEAPWVLCRKEKIEDRNLCRDLPDEEVSPVLLGGAAKAIDTLLKSSPRENPEEWDFLSLYNFHREGVYFTFLSGKEKYRRICSALLERGFLLDPGYPPVNIIPGEYSAGEFKLFRKTLEERR